MLCNFHNILVHEELMCLDGMKVEIFKRLMLPNLILLQAFGLCVSLCSTSGLTAHLHKLRRVTLVQHCRLVKILRSERFTEHSGQYHGALRRSISCRGNTEQRPHLSLLLKAIQTSAPRINNFPFLLHSVQCLFSFWVAPDPVSVRSTGRSVTCRSEVTAPSGWSSRVRGKRSGEGRSGEWEGQRWGYGP